MGSTNTARNARRYHSGRLSRSSGRRPGKTGAFGRYRWRIRTRIRACRGVRYFQLRVQLATDALWEFSRLDSLQIEIAPLLADRVVGEIVLAEETLSPGRASARTRGCENPIHVRP